MHEKFEQQDLVCYISFAEFPVELYRVDRADEMEGCRIFQGERRLLMLVQIEVVLRDYHKIRAFFFR